ncbi:MAG: permease, partial [Fibrobacterota bacterium]
MEILNSFLSETWSLYNEMAIYLLFGFFVAGILHVFFPQKFVAKHLGKSSVGSVLKSSAFGVPLPLCSCGVIPVAASMRKKGASRGAAISFLISTPQIGADSFMITYSLIGWVFAVFRIGAAFITAVAAGLITNFTGKKERENDKESGNNIVVPDSETVSDRLKVIHRYIQYDLFASIARYLLIGILLGGLISAAVPDGFFKGFLGNQFLSMLIMLAVATPLYVCATASTPIAASLLMKGISPGAALVFLLAGPATNTVTITTVAKSLGKRTAIIYLLSIASVSV